MREIKRLGFISKGDFLHRTELDIGPPPGNWLEELGYSTRRRLVARLVREAMTRDPVCVDDDASLTRSSL